MDTYTESNQGMQARSGQYAKLGMGALGLVALAPLFVVMRPRPVDNRITPMPVAINQLIEAAVKSARRGRRRHYRCREGLCRGTTQAVG
jgi:hypothetical protein